MIPLLSERSAAAEKVIWARISIVYNKSEIVDQMLQIPILDSIIETHSVIKSHARLHILTYRL